MYKRGNELEIRKFFGNTTWTDILDQWVREMNTYQIDLDKVVFQAPVHDPGYPGRLEDQFTWWDADAVENKHWDLQIYFIEWPGTPGHCAYPHRVSLVRSVEYITEAQGDTASLCAVLVRASLFGRLNKPQIWYPENWPHYGCIFALDQMAAEALEPVGISARWHHRSSYALPISEDERKVDDLSGMVKFLAAEHARNLLEMRPVRIHFMDAFPVIFKERVDTWVAELEQSKQESDEEWLAQQQRKRIEIAMKDKKHPLWREWPYIEEDELERLVWTKPKVQIAKDYGVSDVAVGKKCKRLGIRTPGPGFWAKVYAGKIPHPRGKPIDTK